MALLKHFFHDGAASNQRLPAPLAEKELNDRRIKKLNILIAKIAIRGDGKSPDQKVIDMQLQAANLVYIFDVIILSGHCEQKWKADCRDFIFTFKFTSFLL